MEHNLVIETGESFLTHAQLLRHIREKCGDAIADYLSGFLGEDAVSAKNKDLLKKVRDCLDNISSSLSEMEDEIDTAVTAIENATQE